MTRLTALSGARIFDGTGWHDDSAILIGAGCVLDIVAQRAVPADAAMERVGDGVLVPGFLDAQVNGGGGVALNDAPTAETMNRIATAHRQFGTCRLLPTLVTAPPEATAAVLAAARGAGPSIVGLHLEGPHLDPVRQGVHDGRLMRRLSEADIDRLLAADAGRLLLTIAPEQALPAQVRRLVDSGVIVSLGHSDATCEQAMALFDAGATGVTHLFNAMSPQTSRAPGTVGAALAEDALWAGIIADGHHVHPANIRLARQAKPAGRLVLVSDAMATVGGSRGAFSLYGEEIRQSSGKLVNSAGALAGSAIGMIDAVAYSVRSVGIPLAECLRMASLYPAAILRLDHSLGRIAPGYRADLVHFDEQFGVRNTWLAGERRQHR